MDRAVDGTREKFETSQNHGTGPGIRPDGCDAHGNGGHPTVPELGGSASFPFLVRDTVRPQAVFRPSAEYNRKTASTSVIEVYEVDGY